VTPTCPSCSSLDLHHSRLRSWAERARWYVTGRVPFRCHQCNWRGWRRDAAARASGAPLRQIHHELTEAELDQLDPDRRGREEATRPRR
jgi:hypothetical protein